MSVTEYSFDALGGSGRKIFGGRRKVGSGLFSAGFSGLLAVDGGASFC